MSKSKNDFFCMGGTARFFVRSHRGKQDAVYQLINPETNCPYTNQQLYSALEAKNTKNNILSPMIQTQLQELSSKVLHHPTATFCLSHRDTTKEKAKENAEKLLLPHLQEIARLLFRPQWEINVKGGNVTILQFVHYMGDALYPNQTDANRKRFQSALNHVILPVIGNLKLSELNAKKQKSIVRKINSFLQSEKASSAKRSYTKRAYSGLFTAINSSGCSLVSASVDLVNMIDRVRSNNHTLLNSFRPKHLDEMQRTHLFNLLLTPAYLYELFIVSLMYSGLNLFEISALTFADIDCTDIEQATCYSILVHRMVRKLDKRYSTVSAPNENFPIKLFRRVVLYPWASNILLQYIQHLKDSGYTDQQIKQMRLSDTSYNGILQGPTELSERIGSMLNLSDIEGVQIPRTDKSGKSTLQNFEPTITLLYTDAQYVAETYCGANACMLHSMFGLPWTETDENSYLDLLSEQYAVARYLHLRRFNPFVAVDSLASGTTATQNANELKFHPHAKAKHIVTIHNPTDATQGISLKSNYAINVFWKKETTQ